MTQPELTQEMYDFINSQFLWGQFLSFLEEKGYTDEEVEEATDELYT